MTEKEKILEYITSYKISDKVSRNSMGCNEDWYSPYYAIKETFSIEEVKNMSDSEIDNLVRLAENISEGLY